MRVYVSCEEWDGHMDEPKITVNLDEHNATLDDWRIRVAGGKDLVEESDEWQYYYEGWPGRLIEGEAELLDLLGVGREPLGKAILAITKALGDSFWSDGITEAELDQADVAVKLLKRLLEE